MASRSSCCSMAVRQAPLKSSPVPCRITAVRPFSARALSARARCRPSFRSALTARCYTPSGRSIQAKGIDPDIVVTQTPPEDKKRPSGIGESSLPGHLSADDGDEMAGSDNFVPSDKKEDKQLLYAIDLLNGVK